MFLSTKRFDPDIEENEKREANKKSKLNIGARRPVEKSEHKSKKKAEEHEVQDRRDSSDYIDHGKRHDSEAEDLSDHDKADVSMDRAVSALEIDPKHAALLQKFQTVYKRMENKAAKNDALSDSGSEDEEEDVIRDAEKPADLVPLPQPKQVPQKQAVREIPKWMAEPVFIPTDSTCSFQDLHLSANMLKNLNDLGFKNAFAVQTKVVAAFMDDVRDRVSPDRKSDILVNSFTGSGKTLAYSIPIIESLAQRVVPRIRALIILPTKPLIQQVRNVLEALSTGTSIRTLALRSDRHFADEQTLLTAQVPDIVITTPGRLVDHINNTDGFNLQYLKYLVIDEADRLLNQSFQEWVSTVMSKTPEHPEPPQRPVQKLVFSATLTRDPGKLSSLKISANPRIFIVGDKPDIELEFSVPKTLQEKHVSVNSFTSKPLVLLELLLHFGIFKDTIVFVKSNEAASRLARLLALMDEEISQKNLSVDKCSGEMDVLTRRKKLKQFEQGHIGILVCTDLIARGVDIADVKNVINYDLPIGKRDYVHRVGRTARAGKIGTAWSFTCGKGERIHFQDITDSIYRETQVEQVAESEVRDVRLKKINDDGYKKALQRLEQEVYA